MPLNLYTHEKVTGTPVNFQEAYNEHSEINATGENEREQNTTQKKETGIYDIGDVVMVMIEKILHMAVLTERVTDLTKSYSMELYEEDTGSVFRYLGTKRVSAHNICEELSTESYVKVEENSYNLDEDVLNRIKTSHSEEHMTITEQIEELEDDISMATLDQETRTGRKITAPRRFQDFYYF